MGKLVEKITCKKCSTVKYHDLEALNKEPITTSDSKLTAIIVKKFKCGECSSNNAQREFVKVENSDVI